MNSLARGTRQVPGFHPDRSKPWGTGGGVGGGGVAGAVVLGTTQAVLQEPCSFLSFFLNEDNLQKETNNINQSMFFALNIYFVSLFFHLFPYFFMSMYLLKGVE